MSDWSFDELTQWDERICEIAKGYGLDWFEISYETIDYHEMIGAMSYHGLPSHYAHWSYGKSFERTHGMYNMGLEGLPYELIINSDPSIAYLMVENPLYLQILIMAHCVGHSDFFKNNRTFRNTDPARAPIRFRSARNRIQSYIEDPSIGIDKVETILDACHSIQYQVDRRGRTRLPEKELRREYEQKIKSDKSGKYKNFNIDKLPLEPEFDVLRFILENGRKLADWEKDVIDIVHNESQYFMPQIRTKVMNEGWASFWHYRILHDLELPDAYHIPFLKTHNQVLRPWGLRINPYHLGFEIFKDIEEKMGLDECFFAREIDSDESFIRRYLTEDKARELNLFTFSSKGRKNPDWTVDDIVDETGWNEVRSSLINQVGGNSIPVIYVDNVEKDTLILRHEHDGRDLEIDYADRCVKNIIELWKGPVKLLTQLEGEDFEIS
jgi:stage V sporulation protein R